MLLLLLLLLLLLALRKRGRGRSGKRRWWLRVVLSIEVLRIVELLELVAMSEGFKAFL